MNDRHYYKHKFHRQEPEIVNKKFLFTSYDAQWAALIIGFLLSWGSIFVMNIVTAHYPSIDLVKGMWLVAAFFGSVGSTLYLVMGVISVSGGNMPAPFYRDPDQPIKYTHTRRRGYYD